MRGLETNSSSKWNAGDDSRLLEMKADGKSDRVMANILKRSASAVTQRLYILRDRARLEGR
jgi:hypothetical protein